MGVKYGVDQSDLNDEDFFHEEESEQVKQAFFQELESKKEAADCCKTNPQKSTCDCMDKKGSSR